MDDWISQGITHVMLNKHGQQIIRDEQDSRFSEQDWEELDAMCNEMILLENIGNAYLLYALK